VRRFWIVRRPLDAICSFIVGIRQERKHHPCPPDWKTWQDKSLIERCAHHWHYINSVGFDSGKEIPTLVRFEDMMQAPRQFAKMAPTPIGVDPSAHQNTLEQWAGSAQDTNNTQFVEAQTSRGHTL